MKKIREPAVAGTFYPADPDQLKLLLTHYLNDAKIDTKVPKAIIAPHAGYIYSGPIAASVYARLQQANQLINRVLLIGPSHRVGFDGLAVCTAEQFTTPLGVINIDTDAVSQMAELPFVNYLDQAHTQEHSLEVHLPFLQTVLNKFSLIPVVAGNASADQVCQLIEQFWEKPETLIVISSDLSHFYDYETAQQMDRATSDIIEHLLYEKLDSDFACGHVPVNGLLALARKKGLKIKTIDLRNSGDTAGKDNKNRVVGYGSYVIE
ncbi:MAG: AmmeMemoRadiSam system protein B [Methylococcaceae bacterium]